MASALGSLHCTTIQYAANLAELAYGGFEVSDPLGWDVMDTEASGCLVEKFGGSIHFTGSDLTQGQLSD